MFWHFLCLHTIKTYQNMPKHANTYQNIPKHANTYQNMSTLMCFGMLWHVFAWSKHVKHRSDQFLRDLRFQIEVGQVQMEQVCPFCGRLWPHEGSWNLPSGGKKRLPEHHLKIMVFNKRMAPPLVLPKSKRFGRPYTTPFSGQRVTVNGYCKHTPDWEGSYCG